MPKIKKPSKAQSNTSNSRGKSRRNKGASGSQAFEEYCDKRCDEESGPGADIED